MARAQQGGRSGPAAWSVCLGPGAELEDLGPVLAHLSRTVNSGVDVHITTLGDLAGLMAGFAGRGRLVLQGDNFPDEDIGFVRRFLASNPHWSLVLLGKDAGTRPARVILGMDRTRWLAMPPDLEQMRDLVRYPSILQPPSWEHVEEESELAPPPVPSPTVLPEVSLEGAPPLRRPSAPPHPDPASPVHPLAMKTPPPGSQAPATPPDPPVEGATPSGASPGAPSGTSADAHPGTPPRHPGDERTVDIPRPVPTAVRTSAPARTASAAVASSLDAAPDAIALGLDPAEMRAQVAALADIAQRLELSLESGDDGPPGLGAPGAELARLRRFTHMLGHITSPPRRGEELFDVGDLLEEKLAAVALSTPKGLRFLSKGEPGLRVLADREAVSTALEAVIDLARACARPNGVIKAPYRHGAEGQCELVLDFPAGPLADADPARALRPGGVQQELPDLGPADLPAAAALIAAQGGILAIEAGGDLRLRVRVQLPAHES